MRKCILSLAALCSLMLAFAFLASTEASADCSTSSSDCSGTVSLSSDAHFDCLAVFHADGSRTDMGCHYSSRSVDIAASGGDQYCWSGYDVPPSDDCQKSYFDVSSGGGTVCYTDSPSCAGTATFIPTSNYDCLAIFHADGTRTDQGCQYSNGTIEVYVNNGDTYCWSGNDGRPSDDCQKNYVTVQ